MGAQGCRHLESKLSQDADLLFSHYLFLREREGGGGRSTWQEKLAHSFYTGRPIIDPLKSVNSFSAV